MTVAAAEQSGSGAADTTGTVSTAVVRGRHFTGLDGIRALGALMVLTTHVGFQSGAALNGPFDGVLSRMDSGVAIFFVISGFLLYRPHAIAWLTTSTPPHLGRYFLHRVLRIYPALWITVIGAALIMNPNGPGPRPYVMHALTLQIYTTGNELLGLTQMWSLATEVAFYAALPLFAWLLGRGVPTARSLRARLFLLLCMPLVGASWMALNAAHSQSLRLLWLPGFLGWFAMGMLLALWQSARATGHLETGPMDRLLSSPGTLWATAGALYLVCISPVAGPYRLVEYSPGEAAVKNALYAILGALIVLPSVGLPLGDSGVARHRLVLRVGKFLGDISYGIFCYHLIILGLAERALGHKTFGGDFVRLWILTVIGSVAIASLSFYFVERPIMRWGRRNEPVIRAGKSAVGVNAKATPAITNH